MSRSSWTAYELSKFLRTEWILPILTSYGYGDPVTYTLTFVAGVANILQTQFYSIRVGDVVTGTGIPADTLVTDIDEENLTITISDAFDGIDIATTFTHERQVPVISSHQNSPAPSEPYIVISYAPIKNKIGRASFGNIVIENEGLPNETRTRRVIQDNDLTAIDIKEEGGEGQIVELLQESLEFFTVREVFQNNRVAILEPGNVNPIPRLFNDDYKLGSMFELRLRIASGYIENMNNIENVEFSGTIS